jgi:multisubunit Na+/H+ antiporter MnhB subunit
MIFLYILIIVVLSIFEIRDLSKKKFIKDIYIFIWCMGLVAIFGIVYLIDDLRPSISDYFLKLFNVRG